MSYASELIDRERDANSMLRARIKELEQRLAEAEEKLDTAETTLRTLQAGVARRVYGVLYEDVRPNELILVTVDKLIARLAAAEAQAEALTRGLVKSSAEKLDLTARLAEAEALLRKYEPEPGKCEHGVTEGDWCEPCNREYKQASIEVESEDQI